MTVACADTRHASFHGQSHYVGVCDRLLTGMAEGSAEIGRHQDFKQGVTWSCPREGRARH